ncbi:MAG TPA: type II toxin-antitoxin system RelE/ParE family toxin [Balneolaceae bacterium]|nr:type II toxin-antitoxin system RelE/ParE family toxin [Balneolaceae bacterium]
MPKTLILTQQAQQDLDEAYHWYQEQSQGLGKEFTRCVDAKLATVFRNPLHHQVIFKDTVRRALTDRFPFSIYFVDEEDVITVFAILHQRRNPESWQSRFD